MKKFLMKTFYFIITLLLALKECHSIGENLRLLPSGTTTAFVNTRIIFTCDHSHRNDIESFNWLLNGTEVGSSSSNILIQDYGDNAELIITNLEERFNETFIQCQVTYEDTDVKFSKMSKILLQGNLSAVGSLQTEVTDRNITVTWTAPFSLIVHGSKQIIYHILVQNVSSQQQMSYEVMKTLFVLQSAPFRRITCDEYVFTVIPVNPVGAGEPNEIHQTYDDLNFLRNNLHINSKTHNDIGLTLSSPICRISSLQIINTNLNKTEDIESFNNFTLISSSHDGYNYELAVNLPNNSNYDFNVLVEGALKAKNIHFQSSTHALRSIDITEEATDGLQIQATYHPHRNGYGAFVTMLYCENGTDLECVINFNKSIYFSLSNDDIFFYDRPYSIGYYLLLAYDVQDDNSLRPAENNSIWPAFEAFITLNGSKITYNPSKTISGNCNVAYLNGTVTSNCKFSNTDTIFSERQLILQPKNQHEVRKLTISSSIGACVPLSLNVSKNSYYGITIIVTTSDTIFSNFPISQGTLRNGTIIFEAVEQITENYIIGNCLRSLPAGTISSDIKTELLLILTALSTFIGLKH